MPLTVYIVCAALGGALLASSLVFGHHDDHGGGVDTDQSAWFSLRAATYFLTFFGATGLALHTLSNAPAPIEIGAATLCGAGAAAMATVVFRRLMAENSEGGGTVKNADLIGREATVVVGFDAAATGRVRINGLSSTVEMLCKSDGGAFEEGDTVLVVDIKEGMIANVTALSSDTVRSGSLIKDKT